MHALEQIESLRPSLAEQIKAIIPQIHNREILILGTRERGQKVLQAICTLLAVGYDELYVKGFISSRPQTVSCHGKPIFSPDILSVDKHYVIVATKATDVICQLKWKGFGDASNEDFLKPLYPIWYDDDIVYQNCSVGCGTYWFDTLASYSQLGDHVRIIGRYCSISDMAKVLINPPIHWVTTHPMIYTKDFIPMAANKLQTTFSRPLVEIGNDVWIGANVSILPGIKIGDGAVIGVGAVVTHDIEPYAVVGGIPAKVLKHRFPKNMIDSFLKIKWWDWPIEKIKENFELFYDPEQFCAKFDSEFQTYQD